MWALKFAEQVLENVDQTAAKVVNKSDDLTDDEDYDDDDDEYEYEDDSAYNDVVGDEDDQENHSLKKPSPISPISMLNHDFSSSVVGQEEQAQLSSKVDERSEIEKLQDALFFSKKYFSDPSMIENVVSNLKQQPVDKALTTTTRTRTVVVEVPEDTTKNEETLNENVTTKTSSEAKEDEENNDKNNEQKTTKDKANNNNSNNNKGNNKSKNNKKKNNKVKKNQKASEQSVAEEKEEKEEDESEKQQIVMEEKVEEATSTNEQATDEKKSEIAPVASLDHDSTVVDEEKQILRHSVLHLHEELISLTRQNETLNNKFKEFSGQASKNERYLKEVQERHGSQMSRFLEEKLKTENEFARLMNDKEKQQNNMQTQIDELIQQLKTKDKALTDMKEANDTISKEERRKRTDAQEAYEELKDRYSKLEDKLRSEEEDVKSLRAHFNKRERELLESRTQLESEFTQAQNSLSEKWQDINRLENLLKMKQSEFQLKEQELQEYKNRATKVLLIRDKQIEELKKVRSPDSSVGSNESDLSESRLQDDDDKLLAALDKEDMIMDLERLRAENQELAATLDLVKRQQDAEVTSSRFKIRNLEKSLEREKENVAKIQQAMATIKLSADDAKQKFEAERRDLQEELKKRVADIKTLQSKVTRSSSSTSSDQTEAENRARALAERLIEKQSQLETLNSEKAALYLELDKTKQRIKEVELVARMNPMNEAPRRRTKGHSIDIFDGHDVDAAVPIKTNRVFRNLSQRGFLAKKVASGMQWLDGISIQSARHLRINPLLRILFVVYIFLLHAWVFFILSHTIHIMPSGGSQPSITPQNLAINPQDK